MQRPLAACPGLTVTARCDTAGTIRLLIQAGLPPQTDPRLTSAGFPVTVAVWLSDIPNGSALTAVAADTIALGGSGSNLTVATAGKAVAVNTDSAGRAELLITSAAKTPYFIGLSGPAGSLVAPVTAADYVP